MNVQIDYLETESELTHAIIDTMHNEIASRSPEVVKPYHLDELTFLCYHLAEREVKLSISDGILTFGSKLFSRVFNKREHDEYNIDYVHIQRKTSELLNHYIVSKGRFETKMDEYRHNPTKALFASKNPNKYIEYKAGVTTLNKYTKMKE